MISYLREIWRLRFFWAAMVQIDLKNRYRRSMIGLGWSLLHPIAMTVVLCVVFAQLLAVGLRDYAPLVLSGLIFWNYIVGVMSDGCRCFFQGESYIRQHPAPLAIYPLRTTLGAGIHFLIGLMVVLIFVWTVRGFGNLPALLSLVPTLMLMFIFGWALAICMGMANVFFQDCQHMIAIVLQILFYVTPVMYPADQLRQRHLEWFVNINPLAIILEMLRQPILEGRFPAMETYFFGVLSVTLVAGIAIVTLKCFERRIIFYL